MFLKSVLRVLGTAALQTGLMCCPGLAATHTTSLSVSATVVARCQVSPILNAAKSAVSKSKGWETPISMNCSLPVPYQISVTDSSRTDSASFDSIRSDVTGPSSHAYNPNPGFFQPRRWPDDSAEEPNHGLVRPFSAGLPADSIKAEHRTGEGSHQETITVTVIY
jgi:hypothetical protein